MGSASNRVLVVEDDLDLRDILKEFLSSEGYEVRTAANGVEALRVLDEVPDDPFLILLDLMLPVMDGRTLIKRLSARPRQHRVVLLSADESVTAELSSTVSGMLPKPFDTHELRAVIAGMR